MVLIQCDSLLKFDENMDIIQRLYEYTFSNLVFVTHFFEWTVLFKFSKKKKDFK